MKNNMQNTRKVAHRTKVEKRRLAFEKRNVKKGQSTTYYHAENNSVRIIDKFTRINRQVVAAFMALIFAVTSMIIGINIAARADNPNSNNDNLILSKNITTNENGNYDLTLEAYAKGEIRDVTEQVPTDFILVLDQSGSMDTNDMPTEYEAANNGVDKNWKMNDFDSGAYYYKDPNKDNTYYRVYRKRGVLYDYQPPDTVYVKEVLNKLRWFQGETEQEQETASQYYFRPSDVNPNPADGAGITQTAEGSLVDVSSDDSFYHLNIASRGKLGYYSIKFSYSDADGDKYYFHQPNQPLYKNPLGGYYQPGDGLYNQINDALLWYFNDARCYSYATVFGINTGMYVRQPMYIRNTGYSQLCYKDENGVEHKLIHAMYCNENGVPVGGQCTEANNGIPSVGKDNAKTSTTETFWNGVLYKPVANRTEERLRSLNKALTAFVESTANQSDDYGPVDHRIAMVGFASEGSPYNNTELLTGVPINSTSNMPSGGLSLDGKQHNGPQYSTPTSIADAVYTNTLLSTQDPEQLAELNNAVNYVTAYGGTQPALGLEMAKKVIDNRNITTYTRQSTGKAENRRTVVIFFTDGTPGNYSSKDNPTVFSNQYIEADKVVSAARAIKTDPNNETLIYSVGVFGESDGNPLLYYNGYNSTEGDSSEEDAMDNSMSEKDYDAHLADYYFDGPTSYSISWGRTRYRMTRHYYFRDCAEGVAGYPEQPNDTIADYMETVSSKYPDAKSFSYYETKNNYSSYSQRINAARGTTIDTSQRYYFMATDSESLTKVFTELSNSISESGSALSLTEDNSYLQDIINLEKFNVNSVEVTAKAVNGIIENDAFKELGDADDVLSIDCSTLSSSGTVKVGNFNYTDNYVTETKQGKKIVVTIKDLIPKDDTVGDIINSNTDNSAIFQNGVQKEDGSFEEDKQIKPFVSPAISRHSYKLDVQGENKNNAQFDVTISLTGGSSSLDEVVLVKQNGDRMKYTGAQTITMSDNQSFYFENVPSDYSIQTSFKAKDDEYTYTLWANDEVNNKTDLNTETGTDRTLPYADNTLHIDSVANTRQVEIVETVDGNYANDLDTFKPMVYLVPTSGDVPAEGKTINGTVWTKVDGENKLTTDIAPIRGNGSRVAITVPAGWTLFIEQTDDKEYVVKEPITYVAGSSESQNYDSATGIPLSNNVTINIVNERNNITIEGVSDESNSSKLILYGFAGLATVSAGAGAAYVYRKKDEFVEQ